MRLTDRAARGCRRRACDRPRRPRRRSATCAPRRPRAASRAPRSARPPTRPATCLMQTSKPTVAVSSGRCSSASIAAVRSIIAIIPGVERTLTGMVPPTSVSSGPSTVNSCSRVGAGRRGMAAIPILRCDPVSIIGGTGALGYGLALRLGREGVPVVIGSRDAERAAQAAADARERVPDGDVRGPGQRRGGAARGDRLPHRPVPLAVRDADQPGGPPARGPDPRRLHRPARRRGQRQGHADARRLAGQRRPAGAEMVPDGVRVVAALHTVSAATLARPRPRARRGHPGLRRPKADKRRSSS